ncbi:hypothetical protein [Spongiactinospora sp. 9N601]
MNAPAILPLFRPGAVGGPEKPTPGRLEMTRWRSRESGSTT